MPGTPLHAGVSNTPGAYFAFWLNRNNISITSSWTFSNTLKKVRKPYQCLGCRCQLEHIKIIFFSLQLAGILYIYCAFAALQRPSHHGTCHSRWQATAQRRTGQSLPCATIETPYPPKFCSYLSMLEERLNIFWTLKSNKTISQDHNYLQKRAKKTQE